MLNLFKIISLIFLLSSCGTEDQANINCTLYGTQCREAEAPKEDTSEKQGPKGEQGAKGDTGAAGQDGLDGADGLDGKDGLNGSSIMFITVCQSGAYPEVLMCVDDKLYAVFDGGPHKDRLVYLPPGNYRTTDDGGCLFSVSSACNINY
jgi:hypothetical protein